MSCLPTDQPAPRLRAVFAAPHARRAALIPYLTGGHPDMATSHRLIEVLIDAGADAVELGVPFSDPVADGPVVQRSTHEALLAGITPEHIFKLAGAHSDALPFILLGYLNTVLAYGPARFFRHAAAVGVEALVIPDLPLDEAVRVQKDTGSGSLSELAVKHGIPLVPMATPTSTGARLDLAAQAARAFVYCVAVTGVTGPRGKLSPELPGLIERLRARTAAPLAVGFGISTPEQAAAVAGLADGVIVGSALIEAVSRSNSPEGGCAAAARLVGAVSRAIARG